jgi:transcriptional regulator with XRE-family HTH domain
MVTKLRIARIKTGLSLRQFARNNGLSETTLSRIERGTQYVPPKWRLALAAALDLAVIEICDDRGWPSLLSSSDQSPG